MGDFNLTQYYTIPDYHYQNITLSELDNQSSLFDSDMFWPIGKKEKMQESLVQLDKMKKMQDILAQQKKITQQLQEMDAEKLHEHQ